jgi:hypothetical protein
MLAREKLGMSDSNRVLATVIVARTDVVMIFP